MQGSAANAYIDQDTKFLHASLYRVDSMGIVKISEQMRENLRLTSTAMSRSIAAWPSIGCAWA
jgi:hypothetical protein